MPLFDLRSSRSKSYSKDYQRSLGIPSSKKEIVFSRRSYIESKRKSKEESEEQDGWLLTYSDMVTLLLTFFILMFSFSEVDQAKFEQMKSAITGDLLKREVKKPFEEIEEELPSDFNVETTEATIIEGFVPKIKEEEPEVIWDFVEEQPQFPGGLEAFFKYVSDNLKYPSHARRMGVEGKVFIQFIVDTDGSVTEVKALRGIGAGCDEEAVRVLKDSPKFNPGKQRGRPVKVRMILPVFFKLSK